MSNKAMGKLILQMNLTLDAFAADHESKLDWMLPEQDERQVDYLNNLNKRVGHIILGRKMAEESIPYWEHVASTPSDSRESVYAKFFVNTPKTIFSKTFKRSAGVNTHVENSELTLAIPQLKQKLKDNIIVYGGASFVSSLVERKLIDELNLFFHPVAISQGLKIFNGRTKLKLIDSATYSNGIVLNKFELQ